MDADAQNGFVDPPQALRCASRPHLYPNLARPISTYVASGCHRDARKWRIVTRLNAGRVVQGVKNAPLRDDVLDHWRAEAAGQSDNTRA
jgi:hypothetical protein